MTWSIIQARCCVSHFSFPGPLRHTRPAGGLRRRGPPGQLKPHGGQREAAAESRDVVVVVFVIEIIHYNRKTHEEDDSVFALFSSRCCSQTAHHHKPWKNHEIQNKLQTENIASINFCSLHDFLKEQLVLFGLYWHLLVCILLCYCSSILILYCFYFATCNKRLFFPLR